jgi:hypothetical protein
MCFLLSWARLGAFFRRFFLSRVRQNRHVSSRGGPFAEGVCLYKGREFVRGENTRKARRGFAGRDPKNRKKPLRDTGGFG